MSDNEEIQTDEGNEAQTLEESLEETQRLTTQWSVEDEEEAARERRRRERERQQQTGGDEPSEENLSEETFTDNHASLKPSGPWENDEDEGFSDWSQRLEQRKLRGACQVPTDENEEPRTMEGVEPQGTRESGEQASDDASVPDQRVEEEEDEEASRSEVTEVNDEPDPRTYESYSPEPSPQEVPISSSQLSARNYEEVEEEKPEAQEATVGYSERDQEGETWETPKQEVHALPSDRWEEEEENRRRLSVSSNGEECDETIATTVKVTEIAENLNRSIQKSNSIKKSEPPLPISKIDDRLEQYTHAIETSAKPARLVRQPSLELIAPGDAVSNKKNRWETGEVTTAAKMAPCKDTEGINIGVSDLINQWGKGKCEPDGAQSPPRPLEVKPGDVLSKKSLWEQGPKSRESDKNTSNKKYKFVSTGHGKYEKILVDEP